jgi:hypothetical protein
MDIDVVREDGQSALSSTKFQTRVAKVRRACSLASPTIVQPAPPQAIWWPHPDDRPIGLDRVVAQGAGRRSSQQAAQAMSIAPPASRIW